MLSADFRQKLNPAQLEAVSHTEGPMLVFAGAGSGKTRVITYRAAHIVSGLGVPAYRVMCVTFTNKATGEMRERLRGLLGESARDLWIATFHATGAKLLRRYHDRVGLARDFAIYDESDQRAVMNRVYEDLKLDERLLQPRAALGLIDRFKQEAIAPAMAQERAESEHDRRVAEVYANYEHRLAANNAVDFGDLLKKLVELLEGDEAVRAELQHRFLYVMVDEFQDTNAAQYRIVRALVGPARNLCVVGDDDQAIYRWRGADVRNIQFFKRDFPDAKVVKLEQNYRSTGNILRAANAVIQRLHRREKKVLFTENGEGARVELIAARDEREEAQRVALAVRAAHEQGTALRDIAVFYRIHAQSRPLEEAMRAANLPYAIVGGQRFYERAEVKDLLAYLRLTQNPNDDVSFLRVVNNPPRGIGKTTVDRLTAHARARGSSLWRLVASGDYPADIAAGMRKRLTDFYTLVSDLRRQAATLRDRPADLASAVLERTGYTAMLQSEKSPENEARLENLQELVGSMDAYAQEAEEPSLSDYLERVALSEEAAAAPEGAADKVALMTVHSAKGLEFDTVFVTGLEEGMFPYKGVGLGGDPEELEEERRLGYVAITRARRRLVLSYATFRQIFGTTRVGDPSRFLQEIPEEVMATPVTRLRGGGSLPPGSGPRASVPPASAPAMPGERRIEYDEPAAPAVGSSAHGFRKGMRVKHPKFGLGRVETVEPGAELKLTVYFPGLGASKKVLAEFVQPV
jgi:DNA helicase-2/ATP-dependent DNA helicase PcrA